MSKMPAFLKISGQPGAAIDSSFEAYWPLFGVWAIDIIFALRWLEKLPIKSLEETFCDRDFVSITGLFKMDHLFSTCIVRTKDDLLRDIDLKMDDEGHLPVKRGRNGKVQWKSEQAQRTVLTSVLKRRREELLCEGVSSDLPLFQNVERFGRLLHLNDAEKALLTYATCLSQCGPVNSLLFMKHDNPSDVSDIEAIRILAMLTGYHEEAIRKALQRDRVLLSSGLVGYRPDISYFEGKIGVACSMFSVMFDKWDSDEDLARRVLRSASAGSLALDDFPHLEQDAGLLCAYLQGATRTATHGVNVLLYGPPGTGKTEFAKALASKLGLMLYEIADSDEDGDPINGEKRLSNLNFCQRVLGGKRDVALLFDDVEDVLPGKPDNDLFGVMSSKSEPICGKAWINRSLEDNAVPTLWITNNANIDPAYLRRFDYSLAFCVPSRKVRSRIVEAHLGEHAPDSATVCAIAELDDLTPAQLGRAAKVAKLSALSAPGRAWDYAEMALARSRSLLGQRGKNLKAQAQTQYMLDYLNTDADLPTIIDGLKRRPQASFCLYGPPGTGKSLFARHVADELGKPIIIKQASELLDKYLGETEKRMAAMFEQARDADALLLLDEADSFISDRAGAERKWEVTQTNEFLTQLECFDGLFFATTNHLEMLDGASFRRFSHKIRFDYLNTEQCWNLFVQEFERQGGGLTEAHSVQALLGQLDNLTPGDFAVVLKNQRLLGVPLSAEQFLHGLESEVRVKRHGKGRIGFL